MNWGNVMSEAIDDGANETLNAGEVLYGFAGWLSTRSDTLKIGATENTVPLADLVDLFMKSNSFPPPRSNFQKKIKYPLC